MLRFVLLACLVVAGQAQTFEVVSIKPSGPPGPNNSRRVGANSPDPSRWVGENMSLSNLIMMAYKLRGYEYSGPPLWQTMFNINAKIPAGATKDDLPIMLQNMLNERFHLAFHREQKELAGYELVVAKGGIRMKEHVERPPDQNASGFMGSLKTDKDGFPDIGSRPGMAIMNGKGRANQFNVDAARIAQFLSSQTGKPVEDKTGLMSKYDFTLTYVAGDRALSSAGDDDPGPTIAQAVQEQLGLKLVPVKVTVNMLVVDSIDKTPTEN